MRRRGCAAFLILLSAAGCVRPPEPAAVPAPLTRGGGPGERRAWSLEVHASGNVTVQQVAAPVVLSLHARLEETVLAVEADGRRRISRVWHICPVRVQGSDPGLRKEPATVSMVVLQSPGGESPTDLRPDRLSGDAICYLLNAAGGFLPSLPPEPVSRDTVWRDTRPAGHIRQEFIGRLDAIDPTIHSLITFATQESANLAMPQESTRGMLLEFRLDSRGLTRFDAERGTENRSQQSGSLMLKGYLGRNPVHINIQFTSELEVVQPLPTHEASPCP